MNNTPINYKTYLKTNPIVCNILHINTRNDGTVTFTLFSNVDIDNRKWLAVINDWAVVTGKYTAKSLVRFMRQWAIDHDAGNFIICTESEYNKGYFDGKN